VVPPELLAALRFPKDAGPWVKTLPDDLLQRILDDPTDDQARLVLADWLQAKGDPRGEFIAVQCAIAKGSQLGAKRMRELRKREGELWEANQQRWIDDDGFTGFTCTFHRGFIEELHVQSANWLPEEAWLRTPLRRLLIMKEAGLRELLEHPILEHLRELWIVNFRVDPSVFERLARTRIHTLRMSVPDGVTLIPALIESGLPLEHLAMFSSGVEERGLELICGSPLTQTLKVLEMSNGILSARTAEIIAAAKWKKLRSLWLDSELLEDAGAELLARSPGLSGLRTLGLPHNRLGDRAAEALAASTTLTRLEELDLQGNRRLGDGAWAFARLENLPRLRVLDLTQTWLSPGAVVALAERFGDRLTQSVSDY
jgi:uncharacterized protein (TIGR02996 family)